MKNIRKLDPGYRDYNIEDGQTHIDTKKLDDNAINFTFPLQAESDTRNPQANDQKTENSENRSYNFLRTDMATKKKYYIQ